MTKAKAVLNVIQDQTILEIKVQKPKEQYNLSEAKQIDEIHPFSLAQNIGLAVGDYLISICGYPAAEHNLWDWSEDKNTKIHEYVFFQKEQMQALLVRTNGIPLGMSLAKTNEAIKNQYLKGEGDPDDLYLLWLNYEWDLMTEIFKGLEALQERSFFSKLLYFNFSNIELISTEKFFVGAALYENGDRETGMKLIKHFAENDVQNQTMNYAAMVIYYEAKEQLNCGNREAALEAFLASYDYSKLKPCATEIKKLGGEVPEEKNEWEGQPFPLDYTLPLIKKKKFKKNDSIQLSQVLAQLADNQVHLICLLGSYRCNGPYNDFMQCYTVYAKYFSHIIKGLHVITSNTKEGYWMENEKAARVAKANFDVLYDEEDTLGVAVRQRTSPFILAVNKAGTVVYQDRLISQTSLWELLEVMLTEKDAN